MLLENPCLRRKLVTWCELLMLVQKYKHFVVKQFCPIRMLAWNKSAEVYVFVDLDLRYWFSLMTRTL